MNNIYVYGELAEIVGRSKVVANVSNITELQGYLYQYGKKAVKSYLDEAIILSGKGFNDLKPVTEETAMMQFGDNDIHVIRDIEGEAPAAFAVFAAVVGGGSFYAIAAKIVVSIVINLAISAISNMLSPSADADAPNSNTSENNPGTFFDGAVNQQVQGAPVPIVYGHCRCSSIVIATQLSTEKTSSPS